MSDAHDDPAFQALCREHGIEGTAQVALCGAFWNRALSTPPAVVPAVPSDAELDKVITAHGTGGWQTTDDMRRFARTILALSQTTQPQAEGATTAREQGAEAFLRQMASLPGTFIRSSRDLSPQAITEARASNKWLALRDGLGFAIMAETARQAAEDEQSACAKCSSPDDCGRLGCAATASSGTPLGALPYPMIPPNYLHKDGLLWELVGDHQRAVTVLERDYSARMLDRHIENMMRAYVDADRASRQESPATPPAATPAVPSDAQIITLCGSARFERLFKAWNEALTMSGHTVFSLTAYPSDKAGVKQWYSEEQKTVLDAAHFRKIAVSDAIFVLNLHAYIGESTLREIEHARQLGKAVYFLESWGKGYGIGRSHTDAAQLAAEADGLTIPTASPIDTTTRAGSFDPWGSRLLGPAGIRRSNIVALTRAAALAQPAPVALSPVQPDALRQSIAELEAWEERSDGELLTQGESESVYLVLHELKRLIAAQPAPVAAPAPASEAVNAARYRWLRDQADPDSEQAHCAIHKTNDWGQWVNEWLTGSTLDEHIDAALQTAPPQAAPASEAVAEIVTFGGLDGQKEVSWRKGKMPPVGTKLYAAPPQAGAGNQGEASQPVDGVQGGEG